MDTCTGTTRAGASCKRPAGLDGRCHQHPLEEQPPEADDLVRAARSDDRLRLLRAQRDDVALMLALGVPARDAAALHRRLQSLAEDIATLLDARASATSDPLDELAARRAAALAGA